MTLCEQCELKDTCTKKDNTDEKYYCMDMKPTRCIDPVIKLCQDCRFGHCIYPGWVETAEDLEGCCFDTVCMYGFDKGRPEDEPTEEELKEFEEWVKKSYSNYASEDEDDWLYEI